MAEIKSTLEMVMERAAKLCEQTPDTDNTDCTHDGMRAGAAYMRGDDINLANSIDETADSGKLSFKKGIVETFMRNIILPRDEDQLKEEALSGLQAMPCSEPARLSGMITEMRSILVKYIEHRKQLRQQLEDNFSMQMAQQAGQGVQINPTQHPKFAEEWQNATSSLNEQYGNAINQYKNALTQLLVA